MVMTSRTGLVLLVLLLSTARRVAPQCPDGSQPPCRIAKPGSQAADNRPIAQNSIAVLYFDNLSGDSADTYLADGLTEEVIFRLGQINRLTVQSRYSVRRYRGSASLDVAGLGRSLHVRYLLTGSLRRSSSRVRVLVELANATNGTRLWGETYDVTATDPLGLQQQIAESVAEKIAGRLTDEEHATLGAYPTRSREAYDRFLRGNRYMVERALGQAFPEYDKAFRLDTNFTRAGARLAYLHALALARGDSFPGVPRDSLLARGLRLTARIIQRDPRNSDAWMAQGYLLKFSDPRTYSGVREAFERAVSLEPGNAEAWHQYGSVLNDLGDDSGSADAFRRALSIEPDRWITLNEFSWATTISGHFQDGLRLADSAVAVAPGDWGPRWGRATRLMLIGDTAGARRDADMVVSLGGPGVEGGRDLILAWIAAQAKDSVKMKSFRPLVLSFVDSIRIQRPDLSLSPEGFVAAILPAFLAYGEREQALRILESWSTKGPSLWFWLRWPSCDPLRNDPRFIRVVEESRPAGL